MLETMICSNLLDRGANAGTTRNEIGPSRGPNHLFKVPGCPSLPFLIHFRFSPTHPRPFLFSLSPHARSLRQGGCRRCWLPSWPLFVACCSEGVGQAAAACDGAKNPVSGCGGVLLVKTPGFLCI